LHVFSIVYSARNIIAGSVRTARNTAGREATHVTAGNIDLPQYAAEQGYILDKRESWRGSAVMRNGGDKVVRAQGKCGIRSEPVDPTDAEYDHFPVPHILGGKTVIENARLVHATCYPRGLCKCRPRRRRPDRCGVGLQSRMLTVYFFSGAGITDTTT
jgi:hypothetical protein